MKCEKHMLHVTGFVLVIILMLMKALFKQCPRCFLAFVFVNPYVLFLQYMFYTCLLTLLILLMDLEAS